MDSSLILQYRNRRNAPVIFDLSQRRVKIYSDVFQKIPQFDIAFTDILLQVMAVQSKEGPLRTGWAAQIVRSFPHQDNLFAQPEVLSDFFFSENEDIVKKEAEKVAQKIGCRILAETVAVPERKKQSVFLGMVTLLIGILIILILWLTLNR